MLDSVSAHFRASQRPCFSCFVQGTLVDPIIHFRVWGLPKYNEAPAVIGTEPTFEGLPVIEELGV